MQSQIGIDEVKLPSSSTTLHAGYMYRRLLGSNCCWSLTKDEQRCECYVRQRCSNGCIQWRVCVLDTPAANTKQSKVSSSDTCACEALHTLQHRLSCHNQMHATCQHSCFSAAYLCTCLYVPDATKPSMAAKMPQLLFALFLVTARKPVDRIS
jgi:hypothetical protein